MKQHRDTSPIGLWALHRAKKVDGEVRTPNDLRDIGRIADLEPILLDNPLPDLRRISWDGEGLASCRLRIDVGEYSDEHDGDGPFLGRMDDPDDCLEWPLSVYGDVKECVFGVGPPMGGTWVAMAPHRILLRNEDYGDLVVYEECTVLEGGELLRTIIGITDSIYYDRWDLHYRRVDPGEFRSEVVESANAKAPEPVTLDAPDALRRMVRGGVWMVEGGTGRYDYVWPSGRAVEGSQWVFCDAHGTETLRSDLAFVDDFFPGPISNDSLSGQSPDGRVLDRARVFTPTGWGFIDRRGEVVGDSNWASAHTFVEGRALVLAGERWGYVDPDGVAVIEPTWDAAYAFADGVAVVGRGGLFGMIDRSGAVIAEPRWLYCGLLCEGRAQVQASSTSMWGFIDRDGAEVVPPIYTSVGVFHGGLTRIEKGSESTLIDLGGEPIWPLGTHLVAEPDPGGYAAVRNGTMWGFVDASGNYVIEPKFTEVHTFKGHAACVRTTKGWGSIDRQGNWLVPPTFRQVTRLGHGMWCGETSRKFGLLGATYAVPAIYDRISEPSEGLAAVQLGGRGGFIHVPTGEVAIPFDFASTGSFSEGRAMARDPQTGLLGYIDHRGEWIIEPRYATGEDFKEGVAWVLPHGSKTGRFIDETGTRLFSCKGAKPYSSGEGAFRKLIRGKTGARPPFRPRPHLNRHGLPLHPKAKGSHPFTNGLAWVVAGDFTGWMSRTGKLLRVTR